MLKTAASILGRLLRPRWVVPAAVASTLATVRQVLLSRNETRSPGHRQGLKPPTPSPGRSDG
ncbi:MAG TPA: hypothetical protein VGR90_02380 [Acidimicrobiales bacterium]|nr:hypothetical protein [Acidimicrobiales bacterium]